MNLEELIDILDETVLEGIALPLTNGKCVLDREKLKDIITDIRLNMPNDLRKAKEIVADRTAILENARREAENIIENARKKADFIAGEQEVTRLAAAKANELIQKAQSDTSEIKKGATIYTDSLIESVEEFLTKALLDVKQKKQTIKNHLK